MDASRELRAKLVRLYPRENDARRVARDANVPLDHIDWNGSAVDFWFAVLDEAGKRGLVTAIEQVASEEYPEVMHKQLETPSNTERPLFDYCNNVYIPTYKFDWPLFDELASFFSSRTDIIVLIDTAAARCKAINSGLTVVTASSLPAGPDTTPQDWIRHVFLRASAHGTLVAAALLLELRERPLSPTQRHRIDVMLLELRKLSD